MPKRRSELVRERARTVAKDSSFETKPSRTSSLLQKPVLMPERRSELVRERASTVAKDSSFETMPSRTSSLLQKPSGSHAQT
ncbi:hypothetical protein Psyr_4746 [Pseudomonas syringae pv. syringae B728a]|uniref:Uncharacterized protein n=1 Tax=Pseudomonas syringae pv. syringae (strain B728a) TaxID=205918 RepID=Q4ZM49_PSEU2|nr:hypothetical protein Psyr_4746 [Pseudomonas syringae pv. syringae B728a]